MDHWCKEFRNKRISFVAKMKQMRKIADLVQKSHEARKKAKELLEKAKRKIEELIGPRTRAKHGTG